jgi:TatD DNase family protein
MVYAAVGFHPHIAASITAADWPVLEELARRERVVGLGEFGLDFHYDNSPRDVQTDVFTQGVRLAQALDLPLIIHSRDACRETIDVVDRVAAEGRMPRGVLHCFAGRPEFAKDMAARGFYVSFSGILTFANAEAVRTAAREVPLERILVETDAPYCAPVPMRGKTNEPALMVHTIRRLAEVWGLTETDVRRITRRNAAHLFGLPLAAGDQCLVYPIRRSLYINITNACTNRCVFCPRSQGDMAVKGHNLALAHEPTAAEIVSALEKAGAWTYQEIVFCGFGEPTMRLDVVKDVAREIKRRWRLPTRMNTNGHGSALAGRDIVPELVGVIDALSVSLDAPDAATYERLCHPTIPGAFEAVCEFLRSAKARIPKVRATAVAVPGLDLEATRRLAEQELGVEFEVREYNVVG